MAKRSRQHPAQDTVAPVSGRRTTRRRPVRRERQEGLLERYRGLLLGGVVLVGVLIIGALAFQGTTRASYECITQLTPGPEETVPPIRPTPTPTVAPTPSPTPSPGPTSSDTPDPNATPSPSPSPSPTPSPQPTPAPDPTPRLGFSTTNLGRSHVNDSARTIRYGFCPPTSGDHLSIGGSAPAPMRPGFYPPSQERPPAYWLHNLEHGYVVAAYRCPSGVPGDGDCPSTAEIGQLQAWFDQLPDSGVQGCPSKGVVVRFDGMATRFGLLAWNRALLTDRFELAEALTFARQWTDHDAVPERGAC